MSVIDEPPCSDCGSTTRERSACPYCKQVFCQPCAEKPYEFCCDGGPLPIVPTEEEGREATSRLGIDVHPWAESIRARIAEARKQ